MRVEKGKARGNQARGRREEGGSICLGQLGACLPLAQRDILGPEMGLNGVKTRSAFALSGDKPSEVIEYK